MKNLVFCLIVVFTQADLFQLFNFILSDGIRLRQKDTVNVIFADSNFVVDSQTIVIDKTVFNCSTTLQELPIPANLNSWLRIRMAEVDSFGRYKFIGQYCSTAKFIAFSFNMERQQDSLILTGFRQKISASID